MKALSAALAGVRTRFRAPVVLSGGCVLAASFLVLALAAARPALAEHLTPVSAVDNPPDPRPRPSTPPVVPGALDTLSSHDAMGREFARGGPPRRPGSGAPKDTTRVLPWGAQLWGEGGVGGMVAPTEVKRIFSAGFGGALLLRAEHGHRWETHGRVELQAIPRSSQLQAIDNYGSLVNIPLGGNGLRYSATVGAGARAWHRLWVEGGVGIAHLTVPGADEALGSLDEAAPVTAIRNTTGLAADVQLAWRFPITDTQNMSVTLGWQGNRGGASGRWLHYVPFRIGWQFL